MPSSIMIKYEQVLKLFVVALLPQLTIMWGYLNNVEIILRKNRHFFSNKTMVKIRRVLHGFSVSVVIYATVNRAILIISYLMLKRRHRLSWAIVFCLAKNCNLEYMLAESSHQWKKTYLHTGTNGRSSYVPENWCCMKFQ